MSAVRRWGLLWLVFVSQGALGGEPLWLSDSPPGETARDGGHGHGSSEGGPRGTATKGLWLRAGDSIAAAGHAPMADAIGAVLIDPQRKVRELPLEKRGSGTRISIPVAGEGFYNAYVTRRRVVDDALEVSVAKAELLSHSCRNGHDHVKGMMPYATLDGAPLELVRERAPKEDFHSRIGFGDEVILRVLARGEPAPFSKVTLHTASGWSSSAVADDQGRVRFTLIRDYYPEWSRFDARRRQEFLAVATVRTGESGLHQGVRFGEVRYVATLTGSYYPAAADYRSWGYGLVIGLLGLTFSGATVYLYRRRRARPLREVRFDE